MSAAPDGSAAADRGRYGSPKIHSAYAARGFTQLIPLALGKGPLVSGHHGGSATPLDDVTRAAWRRDHPTANVGVVLPDGVLGLDVDAYGPKPGAATLAALVAAHGVLPPTWRSSARDAPSGIYLFAVPLDLPLRHVESWIREDFGAGLDVIHHANRFVQVYPSVHPSAGNGGGPARVMWHSPDGEPARNTAGWPSVDGLPPLPDGWTAAIRAAVDRPGASIPGGAWIGRDGRAPASPGSAMQRVYALADELAAAPGGEVMCGAALAARNPFWCGGMVTHNGLDEAEVLAVLCGALDGWEFTGSSRREVEKRIRVNLADGIRGCGGWEERDSIWSDTPGMELDGDEGDDEGLTVDRETGEILDGPDDGGTVAEPERNGSAPVRRVFNPDRSRDGDGCACAEPGPGGKGVTHGPGCALDGAGAGEAGRDVGATLKARKAAREEAELDESEARRLAKAAVKAAAKAGKGPKVKIVNGQDDALEHVSDTVLGERFAREVCAGRFRRLAGVKSGGWLAWTGNRWAPMAEAVVHEAAREWIRDGAVSRADLMAMDDRDRRNLLSRGKLTSVAALAGGRPGVLTIPAELDADPDVINTPAGLVDLRTGEVTGHQPGMLVTKITKGNYRSGFTTADWKAALTAICDGCETFLRNRFGQGVTGHRSPDGVMPVLQGGGENGKGALVHEGILTAIGGYGRVLSHRLLDDRFKGGVEQVALAGLRLGLFEELVEDGRFDMSAVRQITDTPRVSARRHHAESEEIELQLSLTATTNPLPVVTDTEHATWRRLALVRFPYRFRKPGEPIEGPDDRRGDPDLKRRLEREQDNADAIVTWLVAGAMAWYSGGAAAISPPPKIVADTLAWRGSTDLIMKFWNETLVRDPGSAIWAADLFAEFVAWCKDSGLTPWGERSFTERFREHSVTRGARVGHAGKQVRQSYLGGQMISRPAGWGPKDTDAFGTPKHNPRDPRTDVRPSTPDRGQFWQGVRFARVADDPSWPEVDQAARARTEID